MADKKTTLMAQFYEQCQTKGYTDMSDATQSLKAKVIASDLKLNYGNIVEFYVKAKNCYDRVQEEKAEEERKAEIGRKAQEEENARRAVGGEWLVTIYGGANSSSDKIEIKVYVRPDHSVYSVIGNGGKIEGAPIVNVLRGAVLTMTYHPSKAIYTGATVGGITTGGVHFTQASYSEKASNTDTGSIQISVNGEEILANRFVVSNLTKSKFKRDPAFCNYVSTGETYCYQSSEMGDLMREAAFMQNVQYTDRMNLLSRAADKDRLPYNTCTEIADLLGRIANAQFPPSDEEVYAAAEALATKATSAEVKRAAEAFRSISDYRDASQRANEAEAKYDEILQEEKEQAILKKEAAAKARKKTTAIIASLVAVAVIAAVVMVKIVIPNGKYNNAIALMEAQKYDEAIATFEALRDYKDSNAKITDCTYAKAVALMDAGKYAEAIVTFEEIAGYKDSANKITECNTAVLDVKYNEALSLLADGKDMQAMLLFGSLGNHKDSQAQSFGLWDKYAVRATISADYHTVGLKADGTVIAVGYNDAGQCDVSAWRDIVAVSAGNAHTVGLKADGTVVAVGDNSRGQCDVSEWRDIVAISAGKYHTMGLKADGTVVAVGDDEYGRDDVSEWRDIVAISAGWDHMVGLKIDGTVIAAGKNKYDQCDVSEWRDIVAISAGERCTVGLKADGTVIAGGDNEYGKCNVSEWRNIVTISVASAHTVGLKTDGTVVATGQDSGGRCDVSAWRDIVAVWAGGGHTVGLKADGTVVTVGYNTYGQCDVSDWTGIRLPNN